jgi:hypothetical protein
VDPDLDADPSIFITDLQDADPDADPSIFITDLQDAIKKLIFLKKFSCILLVKVLVHHSKIKSQKDVTKQ